MKVRSSLEVSSLEPILSIISFLRRGLLARPRLGRIALVGLAALVVQGSGIGSAQAQDTILHTFNLATDGGEPQSALIQASDGNLYGTTPAGGSACSGGGCGTVFEVSKDSGGNFTVFTVLYTFTDGADGAIPKGGLTQGSDGNLYGATLTGGSGGGTVYELSKDSNGNFTVFTVSHTFQPTSPTDNAASPGAGLTLGSDGNLYGTTGIGGEVPTESSGNEGTVYELSKDTNGNFTVFTVLHTFTSAATDGGNPMTPVMQANDGNLYGTTMAGGNGRSGTIYELSKDSNGNFTVFTLLYSFPSAYENESYPSGLMQASDSNLYGTTQAGGNSCNGAGTYGCGSVYSLSKDGNGNFTVFTLLYAFNGDQVSQGVVTGVDGYTWVNSSGGVIQASDGNLYGTTTFGGYWSPTYCTIGTGYGCGTVYELSKDNNGNFTVESVAYSFNDDTTNTSGQPDGYAPEAALTQVAGNFYGTTAEGGVVIIESDTAENLGTVFSFPAPSTGTNPTQTSISGPTITYGANGAVAVTVKSSSGTVAGNASLIVDSGAPQFLPLLNGMATFNIHTPLAGMHSLSASYAAQGNFGASSATGTLQVNQAIPTVTFTGAPASAGYHAMFTVAATTNASTTAVITASGVCTIAGTTVTITKTAGTCNLLANWAADNNYSAASATQSTIATLATPTITWATPAAISYGTALTTKELDAKATYNGVSLAGTFAYSPEKGAVLDAGSETLSVTFTPSNGTDYTMATDEVTLQVNQATPKITWAKPAAITYGTALSNTQLDASTTVRGSFTYMPAAGTVLTAGSQILDVNFTPADTTDYSTASDATTLTVHKATSTIAITSNTPNPSLVNQTVTVGFAVTGGGVGPTGSVTVTASTGETCTGVITANTGSCLLTFTTARSRTLSAKYLGDTNFDSSTSEKVTQVVQE